MTPPLSMPDNPINAVTTKFVRTSTNKMRCPIFCVAVSLNNFHCSFSDLFYSCIILYRVFVKHYNIFKKCFLDRDFISITCLSFIMGFNSI